MLRVTAPTDSLLLLVLFDQHAVDERIRLERFTKGKTSVLLSLYPVGLRFVAKPTYKSGRRASSRSAWLS